MPALELSDIEMAHLSQVQRQLLVRKGEGVRRLHHSVAAAHHSVQQELVRHLWRSPNERAADKVHDAAWLCSRAEHARERLSLPAAW